MRGPPALDTRAGLRHAAIDLFHRLRDLRLPPFVGGDAELALELGAREPQRLERAQQLRIANGARLLVRALALQFFHTLLNPRLSVDQSLATVSHPHLQSVPPPGCESPTL